MITEEFNEKVNELIQRLKGLAKVNELISEFYKDDDCKEVFHQYVSFDEETLCEDMNNTSEELYNLFMEQYKEWEISIYLLFYDYVGNELSSEDVEELEVNISSLIKEIEDRIIREK